MNWVGGNMARPSRLQLRDRFFSVSLTEARSARHVSRARCLASHLSAHRPVRPR